MNEVNNTFDPADFLRTVTHQPGVYRMYGTGDEVIYVGKAKDLKKRLTSYFRKQVSSRKTEALVANIVHIDVTVTHSETEALLLEHNYIKLYQPRYNVLLRDDKSYPFIFLSGDKHPRLAYHRGLNTRKESISGLFRTEERYGKLWRYYRRSFLSGNVKTMFTGTVRVPACNTR